jgi:hypothetical protein
MTGQTGFVDYSELVAGLRDLGTAVDWPVTPDLAAAVAPHLTATAQAGTRPWSWLFKPTLTRAILLAGLLALLVGGAALGIRYGLQLLQIDFGPVPTLAPQSPGAGSTLQLGTRATLDSIRADAAFPVVVPADPGTPDEVYLGGEQLRGQVAFVYAPREDLPPSDLLNGAGLLVTQNRGRIDSSLARKIVETGGVVDRVTVGAWPGYWITGTPHGFWYLAPDGDMISDSGRIVGNTLAWQRDDKLYRIEGDITLERALQIAESIP